MAHRREFVNMKVGVVKVFSYICIVLGLASVIIQIIAMSFSLSQQLPVYYIADQIGLGIWAGSIYTISGRFGLAACKQRSGPLLIKTIILSAISIVLSIAASLLYGFTIFISVFSLCDRQGYNCSSWFVLETILFVISCLVFISDTVLLILASTTLCCCRGKNVSLTMPTDYFQQPYDLSTEEQPVFFQPQTNIIFLTEKPTSVQSAITRY